MALPLKPKRLIQNGLVAHYVPIRQRNLLKWSEDFSNAVWTKSASGTGVTPIVTANHGIAPDNTQTADRIQFNKGAGNTTSDLSNMNQILSGMINPHTVTISIYLKSNDANSYQIALREGESTTLKIITVTTEWQRFFVSVNNYASVNASLQLILRGTYGTSSTADLLVWGAQLELSPSATTYQRTTDLQTLWNQKQENMSVTNIVTNGNFASTSGWSASTASFSVINNTASILATAQYGQIYKTIPTVIGNKYYVKSSIKTAISNIIRLSVGSNYSSLHTGSNNYEKLSIVFTATLSSNSIVIFDNRSTGWDTFYVQQVLAIDLTSLFGAGNEPTVQQCDEIFSNWFDGTIRMNLNRYNGMLGSMSGADATDPVFIGDSLKFDGVDDYIEIPNSEAINISSSFYIEFVFKASIASGYLLSKNLSTVTDVQYGIYWHGTNKSVVGVVNGVARGASNNDSIPVNTWTHVGFYYDKQNIKYYINGILSGTPFPYTDAIIQSSNTLNIGRRKSSAYLTGEIAQINIYNRALTDVERTINYNYLKQIMNIRGIII